MILQKINYFGRVMEKVSEGMPPMGWAKMGFGRGYGVLLGFELDAGFSSPISCKCR